MSIKSDRWIARMSRPPMGALKMGGAWISLDKTEEGKWIIRENGYPVFDSDLERVHEYSEEERQRVIDNGTFKPMIDPFVDHQVKVRRKDMNGPVIDYPNAPGLPYIPQYVDEKIVSYGLSSYGYDVRCADEFKIFTNINSTVVDPKNFNDKIFVDFKGDVCIIPPNSFALARTVERFRIPRNVLTICLGKSTYARCGIIVNVTPFEPEWEGYVTLEFSNTTPLPAKIYANEGVAQVLFFQSDETCAVSYKDREGKYMNQGDKPTTPEV